MHSFLKTFRHEERFVRNVLSPAFHSMQSKFTFKKFETSGGAVMLNPVAVLFSVTFCDAYAHCMFEETRGRKPAEITVP